LIGLALDIVLAVAMPFMAWRALSAEDLYRAIVAFIAFGLLVSLAWAQMGAPNVALAEAAIGTGITGALLLNTLGGMAISRARSEGISANTAYDAVHQSGQVRLATGAISLGLGAALISGIVALANPGSVVANLSARVDENSAAAGVDQPVTAVLLNFRSYDTLLEIGVLLLALAAVWSLGLSRVPSSELVSGAGSPVLHSFLRVLLPVAVVVGGYLLWAGTSYPGGAFQGGAALAAVGALLALSGRLASIGRGGRRKVVLLRIGLFAGAVVGFVVFTGVGLFAMLAGDFLEYRGEAAYALILLIETALTVSIAVTLAALFAMASPLTAESGRRGESEEASA
jgi:uncharacterized MnhB-related membrane protein